MPTRTTQDAAAPAASVANGSQDVKFDPFTHADDTEIFRLRDVEGLSWIEIEERFGGRPWRSLLYRYYLRKGERGSP